VPGREPVLARALVRVPALAADWSLAASLPIRRLRRSL
jgi:hypothetical protein